MAADSMTLPPGFVLEDQPPQLPAGFVLEGDGAQPDTTPPAVNVAPNEPGSEPITGLKAIPHLLNLGIEKAGRGGVGALNLILKGESYLLGQKGQVKHPAVYGKPLFDPAKAPPWVAQVAGGGNPLAPDDIHQGLGESAMRGAAGMTTPENLMMLPLLPLKAVLAALTAQQAANIPGQAVETYKTVTDPNKPLKEKAGAVGDLGQLAAMTVLGAKGLAHEGVPGVVKPPTELEALANEFEQPAPTREGSVVPSQEAAAVNPVVQARPETAPPPVVAPKPPEGFVLEEPNEAIKPAEAAPSVPTEPTPEPTVDDQIARDRQEVEAEADLNHEKRGFAQLLANKTQLKGMTPETKQDFINRADAATTVEQVKALRAEADKAYPANKEAQAASPIERSALGEPTSLDDIAAKVADPKGPRLTKEEIARLPEVGTPEHKAYLDKVKALRAMPRPPVAPEAEAGAAVAGAGKGIVEGLYGSMWERMQKTGYPEPMKNPTADKIAVEFKAGRIKSAEDIRAFVNKPPASPVHPPSFANVPKDEKPVFKMLDIHDKGNAYNSLTKMAENPRYFRPERAALANFLIDNFEHVLRTVGLDPGTGRLDRPNYELIDHSIKLGVDNLRGWPIEDVLLHEAAHAATYWQVTHPKTALQRAAVARLTEIMEQSKARLTSAERAQIGKSQEGMAYHHGSIEEFVASIFNDPRMRDHLSRFSAEGKNLFEQAWDVIKQILGIEKGTALDQTFDVLKEIGQSREGINEARATYALDPVGMPQPTRTAAVIDEATAGEKLSAFVNKAKGYSAPRHAAANAEVANKLVRYASARIAAPEVARSMATDVLGDHWKDKRFDVILGKTLVEDRLRAIKKTFSDLAAKATDPVEQAELTAKANAVTTLIGSEIPTEAAFQKALKNPDIMAAIQRHKDTIQPLAERYHRELGGEVSAPGENTDAFVNLRAMFDDGNPDDAKGMIFGSRKGELTNPLKRGSVFSKQAKGTAERYDLSYRSIAERMVRGNYEQHALREYYQALESSGLGYIEKPKDLTQEAKQTTSGKALATVPVEIKGTAPGTTTLKKLYVRPDLAGELRQAVQTDGAVPRTALGHILNAVTKVQMLGLTDMAYHSVNMLATIAGSQGSRSAWYDVLRKATPVGVIDGATRMGYELVKSIMDTPDMQRAVAELSEIGAGRARPSHQGLLTKGAMKLGVSESAAQWLSSSHYMKLLDRAGRVAMNKMFDNMVERGLLNDTELNRREWNNQMGQYNDRLMGYFQSKLKEGGISSFVVAGRTMNRNALRRITTSNAVRAANPEAWAKMKIVDTVSLAAMLYAFPVAINMLTTGKPFGRPGTHPGAIDVGGEIGPDGKHKELDLLQLLLLRRGQRITGFEALRRGQQEHLPAKDTAQAMVKDIFDGIVHPWAGPTVRTAKVAVTGKDTRGYLESRNPNDFAENLIAAAKNLNPMVAAIFREPDKSKAGSVLSSLAPALGIKESRTPTLEEQGKLEGTIGQRRQAMKQTKPERNELASRAAGERAYWGAYAKQDALKDALPKPQQEFLQKNNLHLRGFETELTVGGTRIPGTREENDFMKEAVRSEYQKQIDRLMQSSAFQSLPEAKKQERLDRSLSQARLRARAQLRRKMSSRSFESYNIGN